MGVWYYTDAMPEPLTIAAAAPLVRSGELTPSELLEQCLRRIDVYEPAVQAWVYLDRERARRDAARLTDEAKAGRVRGPLHGVPVGVKDIIDVFDMPTGCGSKLWANSYARRDATVVERLRQAGAVILGKTVTTPYAYLDPPVTRNPWDLTRTPGGSSSGSAAAVACGMCLAALGTQTGGSPDPAGELLRRVQPEADPRLGQPSTACCRSPRARSRRHHGQLGPRLGGAVRGRSPAYSTTRRRPRRPVPLPIAAADLTRTVEPEG